MYLTTDLEEAGGQTITPPVIGILDRLLSIKHKGAEITRRSSAEATDEDEGKHKAFGRKSNSPFNIAS